MLRVHGPWGPADEPSNCTLPVALATLPVALVWSFHYAYRLLETVSQSNVKQPIFLESDLAARSSSRTSRRVSGSGKSAVNLVMRMMAVPGRSGQESRIAEFIRRQLRKAGAPAAAIDTDNAHRRTILPGETGNLVLKLPGTQRGPRRLLMAHMDTVPICVGSRPVQRNGFVVSDNHDTGLGADDRAGCAVILNAAIQVLRRRLPHPPLTFCWTVQEEVGLQGARMLNLSMLGRPRLAFNWDGGAPEKLTVGATGGYRLTIHVRGIASHAGGAPQHGISAIAIASLAVAKLVRDGWHGEIRRGRNYGTSNVGAIQGGEASNVVTESVLLKVEARSHDPAFRRRIVRQIEHAFQQAARQVRNVAGDRGQVEIEKRLDYEAFQLNPREPCVLAAERAIRATKRQPQHAISNGGVDANWLVARGIATVTMGCGQLNQHTTKEALNVTSYLDACQIAQRLATTMEAEDEA